MLSCRLIASLPPKQFTHQSNNPTTCLPSRRASWLVWQRVAYCFRFISKQNAKLVQSLQSLCLYSGCSGLSCATVKLNHNWLLQCKRQQQMPLVICGWSVAGAVFHNVIIAVWHSRSVCRLLLADLPQLHQLSWCTSRLLTQRLCIIIEWVLNVDGFCLNY